MMLFHRWYWMGTGSVTPPVSSTEDYILTFRRRRR